MRNSKRTLKKRQAIENLIENHYKVDPTLPVNVEPVDIELKEEYSRDRFGKNPTIRRKTKKNLYNKKGKNLWLDNHQNQG